MLANAKDFRKYLWIISIYNWEECIIQDLIDLDQSRKIQFHKIFRVHQVVSLQYPHCPIVWKLIWPSIHEIVFNSIGTVNRTLVFGYPPIHFCSRLFFIFCHIWWFLLVYTDTDTVSVRLPYWHSTGTDRTQTSYSMGTTTLRDTHSN